MWNQIPEMNDLKMLLGEAYFSVWTKLCARIEEKYAMETLWNHGGRAWTYEYKYRRGGKTLCAMYARENCIGFMVILGKAEREKFEVRRQEFMDEIRKIYDEAKTYHDGKWLMFYPENSLMFDDFIKLLEIKRKPNRK